MSFMETGDPSERIKKAFLAALMGGGADTGTQFAMPDGGSGGPKPAPAMTAPADPGMSFPAPTNNFTLPPNTVSDLGGYAGPHSAPPVDTSRLDDLRAKSAAIPDNGVAPVHGLKDHLLNILKTLAPVAAGGMMFGLPGAAGAARGVEGAYQRKADLNIARKHSLEGQAQQEEQGVEHRREFQIGQSEHQREFDQREKDSQSTRDFQEWMKQNEAPHLQQFGPDMKQWNPATHQWEVSGPAPSKQDTSVTPFEVWQKQNPSRAVDDFLKLEQSTKAQPDHSVTPFEAWQRQNPGAPVSDFLKMEQSNKPEKPPSEGERNAMSFYRRGADAEKIISSLEPTIAKKGLMGQLGMKYLPNAMQGDDEQTYQQAQRQFTQAKLRRESGAAISQAEYDQDAKTYFPTPGDSQAVLKRKSDARKAILEELKTASGKAYTETFGDSPKSSGKDFSKELPAAKGKVRKYNPDTDTIE